MSYTRVGGSANGQTAIKTYVYNASGGETSLSGADANGQTLAYDTGYEVVFLNGVRLVRNSDYSATTGTSITGLSALSAGDVVEVMSFVSVNTAIEAMTQAYADGAYVPKTLISGSKGALITSNGTAIAALPSGSDGYVLTSDSSAANGVAWKNDPPLDEFLLMGA